MATARTARPKNPGRGTPAQKAEALGDDAVTFDFDGVTYTVDRDLDIDALDAIEENRPIRAVKILLGPGGYEKFRAEHSKVSDIGAFWEQFGKASRAGNS